MTNDEIAAARKIIEAATPGPWGLACPFSDENYYGYAIKSLHDASFISAARTGWSEALDEVELLIEDNKLLAAEARRLKNNRRVIEQDMLDEIKKLRAENEKLKAVAEAVIADPDYGCLDHSRLKNKNDKRIIEALKAWRGE